MSTRLHLSSDIRAQQSNCQRLHPDVYMRVFVHQIQQSATLHVITISIQTRDLFSFAYEIIADIEA